MQQADTITRDAARAARRHPARRLRPRHPHGRSRWLTPQRRSPRRLLVQQRL